MVFKIGADGMYPSLTGHSLNTGKAFYTNNPASHPSIAELPPGHVELRGFLSVPVFIGKELLGQISLANPKTAYIPADLEAITRLAGYYSIALQRKRDEEAIAKSEHKFKTVIENIDEYVYSVDYENEHPVSHYHSPQCIKITGYRPEDFDVDPYLWISMVHEEDRPKVLEYLELVRLGQNVTPVEHRIIRKDGRLSWVLNTCTVERTPDGSIRRTLGFIIDMNDRILMEHEILEARFAAEEANRAKSEFLASMSHELRTPLNSILGFSQLLKLDPSGHLNDKQKSYINFIQTSGEHLLGMIGDILDLAKIEAGKIELEKKFLLEPVIRKTVSTMKAQIEKRNLHFILTIADDVGILDADEGRIRQILYNLLSNAIKFTGQGKQVGLEVYSEGNRINISVWDQGME
ncbi:hypothetical protein MASR2M78_25820 [Treponema sp.]